VLRPRASTATTTGQRPDNDNLDPGCGGDRGSRGHPPEPDPETAQAYIAALDAIDPAIVHRHADDNDGSDADAAINRGRDECSTIRAAPTDRALAPVRCAWHGPGSLVVLYASKRVNASVLVSGCC